MLHIYDDKQLLEEGTDWVGVDSQHEASTDHAPDADYSHVHRKLSQRAEKAEYEADFRKRTEMLVGRLTCRTDRVD